jgi:hypothetical protein
MPGGWQVVEGETSAAAALVSCAKPCNLAGMVPIADPRVWPEPAAAPPRAARLHALSAASLGGATAQASDRDDARILASLAGMIDARDGAQLASVFDSAPSAAIYRHLWRQLACAEAATHGDGMAVTVFALPLVIVAGLEDDEADRARLPGALADARAIGALLREHGALRGNETFGLANVLAGSASIDVARLPHVLAWRTLPGRDAPDAAHELLPAPIELADRHARVHLRFLVGTAVAAPGVDLLADASVGKWGIPVTRELGRQLTPTGASVLVLPHAPRRLVAAVAHGRAMQRETSAQLFASNAIRKLRAAVGEPVAVISAHRVADEPRGGELRVSLSSVFDPGEAEGFRCPLYPIDHANDVTQMLVTLLRDCRVTDIRVMAGVHADRDGETGLPLLFKADALPH